ncbi:hypothetical protein [Sphingopyxis sp.]|uniref:hypothetical protein n=1 Tax=Sphingopyxis sp. TaxID=1908224 RepID=UPI0025CF8921|nr:hypothetical protein [Sphingopyxis sp.]
MTIPAADIFAAIGSATTPLTLARAADGFLPLLLADLARASDKRLAYIATDDTAMQAIADAAPFFAPDLTVHRFPAWGLPALRPRRAVDACQRRPAGDFVGAASPGRAAS